jgi:hypothetical protein
MARSLDYRAHYFRKRSATLISWGQQQTFQDEARWLAARIEKGRKSANAKRSGEVRVLSAEERKAIEDQMRAEGRL